MSKHTAEEWIAIWILRGYKFTARTGPCVHYDSKEGDLLLGRIWRDLYGKGDRRFRQYEAAKLTLGVPREKASTEFEKWTWMFWDRWDRE